MIRHLRIERSISEGTNTNGMIVESFLTDTVCVVCVNFIYGMGIVHNRRKCFVNAGKDNPALWYKQFDDALFVLCETMKLLESKPPRRFAEGWKKIITEENFAPENWEVIEE